MKQCRKNALIKIWKPLALTVAVVANNVVVMAQTASGSNGISEATTKMKEYFNTGENLMYAVGGVLGLVGAIKVYQKWNHGDHDTSKVAAAWFGSCIFLVIVATVLKQFFGIN